MGSINLRIHGTYIFTYGDCGKGILNRLTHLLQRYGSLNKLQHVRVHAKIVFVCFHKASFGENKLNVNIGIQ